MKRRRFISLRAGLVLSAVLLIFGLAVPATAATLGARSLAVANVRPSVVTSHTFGMTFTTAGSVGSIVFEYCANDPLLDTPCTTPVGLDVSAAVLQTQTGETGFSVAAETTANRLVINRMPAVVTPGASSYMFGNVRNPSTKGAQYVRITTHASTDGSGARIEGGGVAYNIQEGISTAAYVPPFLVFCSGVTVGVDCSSATGFYVNLGELRANQPATGTSQYTAATNDESGYTVSIFGTTLTSGNNVIPALTTASPSFSGTGQFGVNLRANTNPSSGQEPAGSGTASPEAGYNVPNSFKFVSGDLLSSSSLPSDYNRFTITYMANVPADQPAGIYAATFTFVAVATF